MSYTYEPEIEEEDGGYSIPKILVAVLLLIVIGAGAYIYYQQKKISNSIAYLINAKKQVEQDLNEMIEKYNLAIEDNDFLADELRAERDRIIRFRDSIKNVKGEDFTRISSYEKQIKNLKESSAIVFDDTKIINTPPADIDETVTLPVTEEVEPEPKETVTETKPKETKPPVLKEKTKKTEPKTEVVSEESANDIASTETVSVPEETVAETATTEAKVEETAKEEPKTTIPEKKVNYTNFTRVETPPTYPGCKGSATVKKACFTKKVKSFVSKKFNADVVDGMAMSSGKKRIWVSFKIDKFGNITAVNAVPPKNVSEKVAVKLKKEAERVVKKLPKMTAARQNGNPVTIKYSVPITFLAP